MPPVYCCHCRDCQTWSGSAFSEQAVVGEAQVVVTHGEVEIYERVNESGAISVQRLCGSCHTRLWNTNSARPGIAVIRAGTLDASDALIPRAHMWVRRKQPWITIAPDVAAWDETPDPQQLVAVMLERRP